MMFKADIYERACGFPKYKGEISIVAESLKDAKEKMKKLEDKNNWNLSNIRPG